MPFSNLDYLLEHLPARFRRGGSGLFLRRFLSWFGEEMDAADDKLDSFYQRIEPETASEEFLNWWLWSLFGWGWFPAWFTLERKRAFYAYITRHYARRGTARGIQEFLAAFGIEASVETQPLAWGEWTWGEDLFSISGPLVIIVRVRPGFGAVPEDLSYWGEYTWGEDHFAAASEQLQLADIDALLRFVQPMGQMVMIESQTVQEPEAEPVAAFTSEGTEGFAVQFDAADSSVQTGGIVSYKWDFGDDSLEVDDQAPRHEYAAAGSYLVRLTVTADNGQVSTLRKIVGVAFIVPPVLITDDLVASWSFDEPSGDFVDSVAGIHLTPVSVLRVAGKLGLAASFPAGALRRAFCLSQPALQVTGSFTVSAWVFFDDMQDDLPVVSKWQSDFALEYRLSVNSYPSAQFMVIADAESMTPEVVMSDELLNPNEWNLLTARYDATTQRISIQVNDGPIVVGTQDVVPLVGASKFSVGYDFEYEVTFGGKVDEAKVWQRAITEEEANQRYNEGW
jgi:phage tail-like protein